MFARFIGLLREPDEEAIKEFRKLSERRNVEGDSGLIRQKSALRASKGTRENEEEELLPDAFNADFKRVLFSLQELERFRLKVIDWLYPE